MLSNLSSLAAPEVVSMTTSGEASDEKFINVMIFLFHQRLFDNPQCLR